MALSRRRTPISIPILNLSPIPNPPSHPTLLLRLDARLHLETSPRRQMNLRPTSRQRWRHPPSRFHYR
jgi:hypothetical protein